MGFTIPNYETAVGNINGVGDQAEPDSVDFQILGNNTCGVVSGGVITGSSSSMSISISDYVVVSNGAYLTKASVPSVTLDDGGTNPRYDLVVVTSSNTVAVRKGTESSTNPLFPALTSGDVVLGSVYRPAGGGSSSYPVTDRIVDKRQMLLSNTTWLKTSSPNVDTDGALAVNGDIWIDTSANATGQSNIWVKSSGTWQSLAKYTQMESTNTVSTLVLRDSSGNFDAGTVTANLTGNVTGNVTGTVSGNAGTATTLQTARSIAVGGILSGSASFNGSSDVIITASFSGTPVTESVINYSSVPKQTVSASSPTGGKLHDIWIKV